MTYSIVARDADTGELGVAVQSHWFSVGSVVTWARAGIGAVATQSIAEPAYGPRLLDRMAAGETPAAALDAELASDGGARFRQVAVVDRAGSVAGHSGDGCVGHAGRVAGDGFSAQANLMASARVWPAMGEAFEGATGPLSRRLLAALIAGEDAGGDVRGRQSAALLIVPGEGEGWERVLELRVEDHPEPLVELERLLDVGDAYALATEGDALTAAGHYAAAAERYGRAAGLAPGNNELAFWAGLGLAQGGQVDEGLQQVRGAIEAEPGWADVLARLAPEVAPAAERVREALDIDPAPS